MTPGLAPLFVLFRRLCELKFSLALVVLSATPVSALAKALTITLPRPRAGPGCGLRRARRRIQQAMQDRRARRARARMMKRREESWQDNCRRLDAKFLVDVLTSMRWCCYSGLKRRCATD